MKFGGNADACFCAFTRNQSSSGSTPLGNAPQRTSGRLVRIRDVHGLQLSRNLLPSHRPVWLHDRQAKWCRPHNGRHLLLAQPFKRDRHLLNSTPSNFDGEIAIGVGETFGRDGFRDESCGGVQPVLNRLRSTEEVSDTREDL